MFLTIKEQYYFKILKPWFNICKIAGNTLGVKWPEESCKKLIGNKNASGKRSEETRENIRQSQIGNTKTLGKHWKQSEESVKKKSERMKGVNTWTKGSRASEDTKRKLRDKWVIRKLKQHNGLLCHQEQEKTG